MGAVLEVQGLSVAYAQHAPVVEGCSFRVGEAGGTAVLGANGAGKSTTLKAVAGLMPARTGKILYRGEDITGWPTRRRVRAGITFVPEGREIVYSLSVRENLVLGGYRLSRSERNARIEMVMDIFPEIAPRLDGDSWRLSGGEQQMLAIGRALMTGPRVLLMDEPSLGLAPILVKRVFQRLEDIRQDRELSVLLVEQNFHLALRLVEYVYFMRNGRIIDEGTAEDVRSQEATGDVVSSYLGGGG